MPRLLVLVVLCLVLGCGEERAAPSPSPSPPAARRDADEAMRRGLVEPVTRAVRRSCVRAARRADRVAVRCPDVLPAGEYEVPQSYGRGRCQWLLNLEPRRRGSRAPSGIFHVLIGGTCERWKELTATPGRSWPGARPAGDQLRLIGPAEQGLKAPTTLRRVRIGGRPALVLRAAPYPGGGIHGDHLALVFNVGREGHLVSGHAGRGGPTPAGEPVVQALLEVAGSMSRATPVSP
ncbi:MAG: hypothetical protein AVDCRST_MAG13-1072 [uncultured Solirubrobacteraceae bacterium]|uniref:Secreted protein n=1 Tax=uncultured Solirubrobacteraceae bacterium TaxID=1162706 RepID=A0A6J4RQD5_9ACTN|nr:MAG: hypothetical protein AVDCRST_MAG13-1072 [uncultured Solirubrobacteraceae bacterium]